MGELNSFLRPRTQSRAINSKSIMVSTAIVSITAALLISLVMVISKSWTQPLPSIETQIQVQTVVSDQIEAFLAKDHERAFSFAAPSIKKMFVNADRFMMMVKSQYMPVYAPKSFSFAKFEATAADAAQEVNLIGPQGKSWTALYQLQKQNDGFWKINGVILKKAGSAV